MKNLETLTEEKLSYLHCWFTGYVHSFQSNDESTRKSMLLKKDHSLRVCKEAFTIGTALGLSAGQLRLVEVTAMLHDIGRFEQYSRYHTFVDSKSENHAELGVKVLRESCILNNMERSAREIIFKAISYHNRLNLPDNEKSTCLLCSKLLRDADKLDIWEIVFQYYGNNGSDKSSAIELDLPDTFDVSDNVVNGILEKKIVPFKILRSLNDFKLLQMGWVYDINFKPTFQEIQKRGYLEMLRGVLPQSKKIDHIYSSLQSYVADKIHEQ